MLPIIYRLWTLTQSKQVLGAIWYPMPYWLKRVIQRYPLPKQVHTYARLLIGKDLSYLVSNELGCSEAVSRILMEIGVLPRVITGTYTLYEFLYMSGKFMKVSVPQVGDIIISPTGMGEMRHGHVGIMDSNNRILSNSSTSGKWTSNFTLTSWNAYYKVSGKFPVFFYRIIK